MTEMQIRLADDLFNNKLLSAFLLSTKFEFVGFGPTKPSLLLFQPQLPRYQTQHILQSAKTCLSNRDWL
jgi:hypothetical protein